MKRLVSKCGERLLDVRQCKLFTLQNGKKQLFLSATNFRTTDKIVQRNNNICQIICVKNSSSGNILI